MKEVEIKTMTLPQLFAYGADKVNPVGSEESGFSYKEGIPMMYSSRTGKKVRRADMNGIGKMASQSKFFNQLGGYYTFNKEVSDAIGGYPLGAILHYKEPDTGYVRVVRSLVEENTFDFVSEEAHVDGEHWSYVDEIIPSGCRPKVFADLSGLTTGTLDKDEELTISCDSIFTIESGVTLDQKITSDMSSSEVYLNVKKYGSTDFHSAALLAYAAPMSAAYSIASTSSEYVYASLEKNSNYSTMYSSSPIQLYLSYGDVVKITTSIDFPYTAKYSYYPLIG